MMKKLLILLAILISASISFGESDSIIPSVRMGSITRTTFVWTTGATNCSASAYSTNLVRGEILRVVLKGTSATNAYSVTMRDEAGFDVLNGAGANLASNTLFSFKPSFDFTARGALTNMAPIVVNDLLQISVTGAGNRVSGQIILFTR